MVSGSFPLKPSSYFSLTPPLPKPQSTV